MSTILLKHMKVYDPAGGRDGALADLLLEEGVVRAVGRDLEAPGAEQLDGEGRLCAAPGLVDMHVHLRDPGFTEKEDILTGCRAAAAGRRDQLLCMPNTKPAVDTPETVRYIWKRRSRRTPASMWRRPSRKGWGMMANCAILRRCARREPPPSATTDAPWWIPARWRRPCARLRSWGVPVVSHCEDLYLSAGGLMNEGRVSRELGVPGVPAAAEDCGTAREIALAAAYGVPVHICHVSTATSVALIRDARRRGVPVTGETAPHYFSLTDEELRARDADLRMSPPLRTENDRRAVIEALRDGTLQAIATDHAPHTPAEKAVFEESAERRRRHGNVAGRGHHVAGAAGLPHAVSAHPPHEHVPGPHARPARRHAGVRRARRRRRVRPGGKLEGGPGTRCTARAATPCSREKRSPAA